jgi:hypothetical protein
MPDDTTVLSLPLIQPSQAQKHVTHNEALRILDVAVQLSVLDRTRQEAPATPTQGDRHIVAAAATGLWAGQEGRIALFANEGWEFYTPLPGWRAHVLAEGQTVVWDGGIWAAPGQGTLAPSELGINTTPDPVNRLAVKSDASLFSHDGAGHQMKINKSAAGQVASLVFQSGFDGRAEVGLIGDNALAIKVSPDGTSFAEALRTDPATARVLLPVGLRLAPGSAAEPSGAFIGDGNTGLFSPAANQIGVATAGVQRVLVGSAGVQIDVPLGGSAVQADAQDVSTPARLVRTDGALAAALASFGTYAAPGAGVNIDLLGAGSAGLYHDSNPGTWPVTPAGVNWHIATARLYSGEAAVQTAVRYTLSGAVTAPDRYHRVRANSGGAWSDWRRTLTADLVLGTVGQSGGVPTGAILERASNANGTYLRLADGTQICTHSLNSALATTAAVGSVFTAPSELAWTFPAAFSAPPNVTCTVRAVDRWGNGRAQNFAEARVRIYGHTNSATLSAIEMTAIGRWF